MNGRHNLRRPKRPRAGNLTGDLRDHPGRPYSGAQRAAKGESIARELVPERGEALAPGKRPPLVHLWRHPNGPRVWIFGQRVHHGATGIALAIALGALRQRNAALFALALCAHDRRDWRVWFAREALPEDGA